MCWQYSQKIFRKTGFTLFKLFPVTIYESSSFPIYSTNLNRLKWFIKLDPTLAFTQTRRKCIVSCKSSFEISPSRWLILVTLSISWLYLVTASLGDHVPDWLVPYHKLYYSLSLKFWGCCSKYFIFNFLFVVPNLLPVRSHCPVLITHRNKVRHILNIIILTTINVII